VPIVGLWRSRLDGEAVASAGEIDVTTHHLALLDEIVDHL
jgi:hypothetical protein